MFTPRRLASYRKLTAPAALFAALLLAGGAAGAADPLPPDSIGDSTVAFFHLGGANLTPTSLQATAKALLGENAVMAGPLIEQFAAQYDAAIKAGVVDAASVVSFPEPKKPHVVLYVRLRDAGSYEAVKQVISQRLLSAHDREVCQFSHAGDYLVMHEKGQEPPAPSAERRKLFAEMTAGAADDAVTVVFAITDAVRNDLLQELAIPIEPLQQLFGAVLTSQASVLSVRLGEAPRLVLVTRAADEVASKALAEKFAQATAALKKMAADAKANPSAPPSPEVATMDALADAVQPKQAGNTVTVTLDPPAIAKLAGGIVPAMMAAKENAKAVAAMSSLRQLSVAVQLYANDHQDALPDSIDQLKEYLGGKDDPGAMDRVMTNPRTGEKPGFIYVKPAPRMRDVQDASKTPMLFETRNGQKDPAGAVGYVDGHVDRP